MPMSNGRAFLPKTGLNGLHLGYKPLNLQRTFKTTKDPLITFDETKRKEILNTFSFPENPLDNTIDFTITKFPFIPSGKYNIRA